MGLSGMAFGASNALEDILKEQMVRAQLAQQEQERAARLKMDETRLNASLADQADDRKYRARQEDRMDADRRSKSNQAGVRRMIGDSLMQRTGPMTPEDRRSIAALQVEAGDLPDMSLLTEPKPMRDPIADHEAMVKIDAKYREPRQGPQAEFEWIVRNGSPLQIRKGSAQPGDRPYEKPATNTNAPDPAKAADIQQRILETAKKLKTSPGLGALTGSRIGNPAYGMGLANEPIAGTKAANAKALFDTLKSVMTLENLGMLKGAMSDKDLLFLKSAGSSLETSMDDPAFLNELDGIISKVESHMSGAPVQPSPSHGPTAATDPRVDALLKKYGGG